MYFPKSADIDGILSLLKPKLNAVLNNAKWGVDVLIKEHQKKRSNEQNKYMWAIYDHIVKFYQDTGFIIDNLQIKNLNSEFLHAYFKAKFDIKTTSNLSTTEFMAFTDHIQLEMTEQSKGFYDPIYPEDRFQPIY